MSAERAVMTTGHGGQPQSLRVIAKSCVPNCDTRGSARCKAGSEFVDGCDRREIRSLIGVAPGAASNRVGRAVRESATFQRRDW